MDTAAAVDAGVRRNCCVTRRSVRHSNDRVACILKVLTVVTHHLMYSEPLNSCDRRILVGEPRMVVKRGGTGPHPTSKGKTLQWKMNRMAALIGEGT